MLKSKKEYCEIIKKNTMCSAEDAEILYDMSVKQAKEQDCSLPYSIECTIRRFV